MVQNQKHVILSCECPLCVRAKEIAAREKPRRKGWRGMRHIVAMALLLAACAPVQDDAWDAPTKRSPLSMAWDRAMKACSYNVVITDTEVFSEKYPFQNTYSFTFRCADTGRTVGPYTYVERVL